ncbi:MAG TPA: 30S ribosomal protein S12 methylthiotransferase RimO [Bacteroidales bacterium]|nr:30S ribosomal protein S12 methylthiotransferase RimO [Bacteroidales bacterium]
MSKSINIVTLGCSKNVVDSEKLVKQLAYNGYNVEFDSDNIASDIVIINTCGFINDAKEESADTILRFIRAKEKGDIGKLYVMGCLSERYKDDLRKEIPEVDQYFGVNDIIPLLNELNSEFRDDLYSDRILSGPGHFAYLKISEGCDRTCSFCVIPGIRGKYISRRVEDLIDESRILAQKGVKELILIAQDLSYYGLDLYGRQMLEPLVREITAIDGIDWVRLHYLYPANFPLEILQLMAGEPKVCNYIDLPVQHISGYVLSKMRRSHNGQETRDLLYRIREDLPAAAIRTTLITGHPGEREKDFKELVRFVEEYRFERLGVFTYSHEESTYGYDNYNDEIPEKVKRERAGIIMAVQQEISLKKNMDLIGKEFNVLIDSKDAGYFTARTEFDSPEVDQEVIIADRGSNHKPGDFVTVRIIDAGEFDLMGEFV